MAAAPDHYVTDSGGSVSAGRFRYGVFSEALAGMSSNSWLDWSASTNVSEISCMHPVIGLPFNWLESAANYAMTNWPGKCTFDASSKRTVIVGTAQGFIGESPTGNRSSAVYFDLVAGEFSTKVWNPFSRDIGHVYDGNQSVPLNGKIYRRPFNSSELYACDLSDDSWSVSKTVSSLSLQVYSQIEAFPDLGSAGSLLILKDSGDLKRWDIATDSLSTVGTYSGVGTYPVIHHNPHDRSVVFGGGNGGISLYRMDSSGTVALLSSSLPAAIGSYANSPMVADPSNRARSLLFAAAGSVHAIDYATGTWAELAALPAGIVSGNMTVCAVHGTGGVIGFEGAGRGSGVSLSQIWIYKT